MASTTTAALGRTAVVVGGIVVSLTLLTGFIGAILRLAFHGLLVGHGGMTGVEAASFEMGFGVPLASVVALSAVVALPVGLGYFVYTLRSGSARVSRTDAFGVDGGDS